jgi:O-antigen ligase
MRFSLGLTVLVIIMLLFSVWRSFYYPEDNNWGYFFETEYSIFLHRSYWATYTALASAALLHVLFTKSAYRNLVYFSAWLLLSCSTFLTISKAGIIIWFILTTSTVVHWFISSKHYKTLVLSIAVVFGLTALILFTNNRISSRFKEIPKAMNAQDNERETSIESNEARLTMWTTSWEIIKDNWLFGVGTGDVKDALISKNVALGNLEIAEKKLNSHNQFLNTWVQLGIGGLFCLLMIFVATWNSTKSFYGAIFILAFGTTMLFESFIETQGGIVPFCLLLGLFQLNYSEKSDVPVT